MENWNRVIAVDLTGTWSCMRYELPEIVEAGGGSIVNCASVAGLRGRAHGVGLHRGEARRRRPDPGRGAASTRGAGVRVNAICPGTVDTPMFRHSMSPEVIERLVATNPTGRLAEASEIAEVGAVAVRGRAGLPHRPGHRRRRRRRRLTARLARSIRVHREDCDAPIPVEHVHDRRAVRRRRRHRRVLGGRPRRHADPDPHDPVPHPRRRGAAEPGRRPGLGHRRGRASTSTSTPTTSRPRSRGSKRSARPSSTVSGSITPAAGSSCAIPRAWSSASCGP